MPPRIVSFALSKKSLRPRNGSSPRDAFAVSANENFPCSTECLRIQIRKGCLLAHNGRPILRHRLGSNFIQLADAQSCDCGAIPRVVMVLPANGNASRGSRNFKEDDPSLRKGKFVNFTEGRIRIGILSNLMFQTIQSLAFLTICRANNRSGLVIHSKDKPSRILSPQICFICQCRKIFADVRSRKIIVRRLELNTLAFPSLNKLE